MKINKMLISIFLVFVLSFSTIVVAENDTETEGVRSKSRMVEVGQDGIMRDVKPMVVARDVAVKKELQNMEQKFQNSSDEEKKEIMTKMKEHNATPGQIAKKRVMARWNNMSDEDKGQLKERIQNKTRELKERANNQSARGQEVKEIVQANRAEMKVAIESLREIGDSVGGLGPNISSIVKEYNSELKETIEAEGLIQNRNGFKRFFAGGDEKAAERIENQVSRNKEKIERIQNDMAEIEDEEISSMMEEHLAVLEAEQERLSNLSSEEKGKKGMFGWMWK